MQIRRSSTCWRPPLIGASIFIACLIGIASQRSGTLSLLWPANSLLLGLVIRNRLNARVATWLCASIGYLGANVATGTSLASAMLINSADIVGVGAAFVISRFIDDADLRLERGVSMFYIVFLAVAAAASSAAIGGVATIVVFHSNNGWADGAIKWFATEFTNYAILLPVVLACPRFGASRSSSRGHVRVGRVLGLLGFLAALIAMSWYTGGATSVGLAMPVLVYAGLTTNAFLTSVMCAISTLAMLAMHLQAAQAGVFPVASSVQIGLSLLTIGPVAVASTMRERDSIDRARITAMVTDDLTSVLRRGEFLRQADITLRKSHAEEQPVALMMMDLDFFKQHNDSHGHLTGDETLIQFARIVCAALSDKDLIGRLGGEEFAAILPGATSEAAIRIAHAIRSAQERYATTTFGRAGPTVSIGIVNHVYEAPTVLKLLSTTSGAYVQEATTVSKLLAAADAAVYAAKCTRNSIVTTTIPPIPRSGLADGVARQVLHETSASGVTTRSRLGRWIYRCFRPNTLRLHRQQTITPRSSMR